MSHPLKKRQKEQSISLECEIGSHSFCFLVGENKEFICEWMAKTSRDEIKLINLFANLPSPFSTLDISINKLECKISEEWMVTRVETSNNLTLGIVFDRKHKRYLIDTNIPLDAVSLKSLPFIGGVLNSFSLKELTLKFVSKGWGQPVESYNNKPPCWVKLPEDLTAGLRLSLAYQLGDEQGIIKSSASNNINQSNVIPFKEQPEQGFVKWKDIGKKLGPVALSRIGVAYKEGNVQLLLDSSTTMGPLSIDLMGLNLKCPINNPRDITPGIKGLGLKLNKPPLKVGGALLVDGDKYTGSAVAKIKDLNLNLLGSYTKINGNDSLFLFGRASKAFGGSPAFFVKEISAGFALNRKLTMPTFETIDQFPLLNSKPDQNIGELFNKWISVEEGANWFALGVKFTSFEIAESKVLVILSMGRQLKVNFVGNSVISLPKKGEKFAHVVIDLLGELNPDEGFLGVEGRLRPESFVLDSRCNITGGFAYYSWFKGAHSGDMVFTVGGYHPKFKVPSHFPKVDRLQINWQISNNISAKGEAYFAMTSAHAMGGGRLELSYSTGNLRAWLSFKSDFFLQWEPFYYEAEIGIRVGASYKLKVWTPFGTINKAFSTELGAKLSITGPPMAGKVKVSWAIISFTVSFGRAEKPEPVKWGAFKEKLLPGKGSEVCQIQVIDGLTGTVKPKQSTEQMVIRPDEFKMRIESYIPVSKIDGLGIDSLSKTSANVLHIRPMQADIESSILNIKVTRVRLNGGENENVSDLILSEFKRDIPDALWGKEKGVDRPGVLKGHLVGMELKASLAKNNLEKIIIPDFDRIESALRIEVKRDEQAYIVCSDFQSIIKKISQAAMLNKRNQLHRTLSVAVDGELFNDKLEKLASNANKLFSSQPQKKVRS